MRLFSSRHFRRLRRRGQAGQSIVILAIGFLALIAFVGIVTDVSLLFVRFSTLRRAVDAAAVAAAGQMRRIEIPDADPILQAKWVGVTDAAQRETIREGESQSRSFANMNLAARQFIEFYGLNPSEVIVEYCNVQANALVSAQVNAQQPLCTPDQRKLVRVTGQIDSPTAFFNLFGIRTIRLQSSSVSETAVLDLVFIMDVSESMLLETTPTTWADVGYNRMYVPPVLRYPNGDTENAAWETLLALSNSQIRNDLMPPGTSDGSGGTYSGGTGAYFTNIPAGGPLQVRTYDLPLPAGVSQVNGGVPRQECQVRFHPGSILDSRIRNPEALGDYVEAFGGSTSALGVWFNRAAGQTLSDLTTSPPRWFGLVPMYNFYGCCNDPNGDFDFSDAICEPFIQARNASTDFMQRLDFVRGDRVAIVTFDRAAMLLDPTPSDNDTRDAFFTDQVSAQSAMRTRVGVRGETNFYVNNDADPLWDGFRTSIGTGVRGYGGMENEQIGAMREHPSFGACPYDDAILPYPLSGLRQRDPANPSGPSVVRNVVLPNRVVALDEIDSLPSWLQTAWQNNRVRSSYINGFYSASNNFNDVFSFYARMRQTYEWQASCRGTNIGEGLAMASQTLGRLGRREGAVWIMVLLSDGAAAATSPATNNAAIAAGTGLQLPLPFQQEASTGATVPNAGQYGAMGVCPYGQDPSGGTTDPRQSPYYAGASRPYAAELVHDIQFPACGDIDPSTRNWCPDNAVPANPADRNNVGPVLINLDDDPSCVNYYDADDYARDWADFIALRELNVFRQSLPNAPLRNSSDTLLPTIFTIGFGLNFERQNCGDNFFGAADTNQRWACNLEDYLGEELLRYIADAGDNFRMDSDYWQFQLGYRIPNRVTNLTGGASPDWGPRGPCETPGGTQGVWSPLPPQTDCGNYWAVSDQNRRELDQVFAEIASRMFTRLSG
jgi:hypothetical protein